MSYGAASTLDSYRLPNPDTTAPLQEKRQSFLSKIVAAFGKSARPDAEKFSERAAK
jgi:hypothetical protein